MVEEKIIELATERTTEQNFASIGSEYFNELSDIRKNDLAMYGTIDEDSGLLMLVVRPELVDTLTQIVNQINQQWSDKNAIQ